MSGKTFVKATIMRMDKNEYGDAFDYDADAFVNVLTLQQPR